MSQALPPESTALFLDIDGTLLDFAPTPDGVRVPEGLVGTLRAIQAALGGAFAFLTGRRLSDVDALFGPGFPAAAEHGALVRDAAGAVTRLVQPVPEMDRWRAEMERFAARLPGLLIEPKSVGFTVHFRQVPALEGQVLHALRQLVGGRGEILPASRAFEVRPPNTGKGRALSWYMARPPYQGRLPFFVGDDVTDEAAIAAAFSEGGAGLHVARNFGGQPGRVRGWLETIHKTATETPHGRA